MPRNAEPGDHVGRGNRKGTSMPGKRVQFDDETWNALDLLARDRMALKRMEYCLIAAVVLVGIIECIQSLVPA
jgi:hypothetical protein